MVSKPIPQPPPLHYEESEYFNEYQENLNALHHDWITQDPTRKSGYVYGIWMITPGKHCRDGSSDIKIGMTRDPQLRFKQISKTNVKMPYTLRLAFEAWTDDMVRAERLLHTMLQQYRIDGEWFHIPQEIDLALTSLWYIEPFFSSDSLDFRETFSGQWYTPHDFFQEQIKRFRDGGAL